MVAEGIDAPPGSSAPLAAYVFDCADGQKFVLARTTAKPDAVDLVLGERRERLTHVPTGSGAQYVAGGTSVWTKGRDAMLEVEGRVVTCVENRPRSILEDARARGVEFRASGNEPGWVWELLPDGMVFVGAYGAERLTMSRADTRSTSSLGVGVYVGVARGHQLTARVLPGPCVDSMSGVQFTSTVQVELDGKAYRGCGEALR